METSKELREVTFVMENAVRKVEGFGNKNG
jgi:hypothetical protein